MAPAPIFDWSRKPRPPTTRPFTIAVRLCMLAGLRNCFMFIGSPRRSRSDQRRHPLNHMRLRGRHIVLDLAHGIRQDLGQELLKDSERLVLRPVRPDTAWIQAADRQPKKLPGPAACIRALEQDVLRHRTLSPEADLR
jgi:hypothetical protein